MPTNTYVALANTTLGTATNQVTFSSIAGTYTDLVLTFTGGSASGQALLVQVNGDTGANYSSTELSGNGTSATSSRDPNTNFANIGGVWNSTGANILHFMNYSNTTTYKTILTRNNDAAFVARASVSLWRNTAAITSIKIFPNSSVNFNVGSTFSLYGISNAGDATPKATGGDVFEDATHWYHSFTMSGNFVPNQTLSCDVLQIAGGGGGSTGGGGAGGLLYYSSQSLTAGTYQALIGAGGASGTSSTDGITGSNTSFGSLTASVGGGGGGDLDGSVGLTGGSGGGGGCSDPTGFAGGSGTSGQGSAGGSGSPRNAGAGGGGGGGGAGGNGTSATSSGDGNGGVGINTYSTFATVTSTGVSGYYAGGGGGGANINNRGTGGSGGGGNGYKATGAVAGSAGTANTGGGGGAVWNSGHSYPGGSGVVIVRYLKA
jgi:hypothetical protein